MYKADKRGKPILFISVFYETTSVQDKEKNLNSNYTQLAYHLASHVKEICSVGTLFMLPKSEEPNCNPYFIKTETTAINPQRIFQMSMQSLQNSSLVKILPTISILNCWIQKVNYICISFSLSILSLKNPVKCNKHENNWLHTETIDVVNF